VRAGILFALSGRARSEVWLWGVFVELRRVASDFVPWRLGPSENVSLDRNARVAVNGTERDPMHFAIVKAAQGRPADTAEGDAPALRVEVAGEQRLP
jgi:hypothetical protein